MNIASDGVRNTWSGKRLTREPKNEGLISIKGEGINNQQEIEYSELCHLRPMNVNVFVLCIDG